MQFTAELVISAGTAGGSDELWQRLACKRPRRRVTDVMAPETEREQTVKRLRGRRLTTPSGPGPLSEGVGFKTEESAE